MAERGTEKKPAREKPFGAKAAAGWFHMARSRI
jgi:cyclic beta-1,2-glucan synthetase